MKITRVKMSLVENNPKFKARVSVTLDHCFAIHDIKILRIFGGQYILAMPSEHRHGIYSDVVHPINSETREYFTQTILDHYFSIINGDTEE